MIPRVLVIDNYDSFVYNLVQYLGELGAEPLVYRNDEIDIAGIRRREPHAIIISPGPGRPEDAGISMEVIAEMGGPAGGGEMGGPAGGEERRRAGIPVLGVCLGHQCIGQVYGASIVRADQVMHGKTSMISHDGKGVFAGLPDPFEATRYHSLVIEPSTVPPVLTVTARTSDGTVMGVRHTVFPVEGVQFHPESIFTRPGHDLIENFLRQVEETAAH